MEITKVKIFYCSECGKKFLDDKELHECPSCGSGIIAGIPRNTVKVCLNEV